MEEYPEEVRTPPVRLASLVGCPELHSAISTRLNSEHPPIHTLAFPDLSQLSLLLHRPYSSPLKDPSSPDSPPPAGILKRHWLLKHRTKVPAVLAALFPSEHVSGDPAQWLQLCSDIDFLKTLIRARSLKWIIVIVYSNSKDDINEDRMTAIRKRAEVESKYILFLNPNDASELKQSMNRLGNMLSELANTYYKDEGRRIKMRIEKRTNNSSELNVHYCFKIAVYAEFRRDWIEALRFYEDAYNTLREMIGTSTRLPAIQRLVEIKTVAELLHFKISTLLLHSGKIKEAVTWFGRHTASYRRLCGVPQAAFLHWEWMSRQFLVFAELLETCSEIAESVSSLVQGNGDRNLTEWEFYPAYYYQVAADYLMEKQSSLELAISTSDAVYENISNAESVVSSFYVGQFSKLLEVEDGLITQPLTDEEYMHYAVSEGKRFQDSFEIISLLKKAHEYYSSTKIRRMSYFCEFQMAREYYAIGDFSNAKQHFDSVASIYRQEGWVILLWEALGYLRECSRKRGMVKEFVEFSLEMAALPVSPGPGMESNKGCCPVGPATLSQRESIHVEIFKIISEQTFLESVGNGDDIKVTGENPLYLEIDLVSPLRLVLLASVAFHEQVIKPGVSSLLTVSLLSQLPHSFEIDQLEVQFNQSDCNFIITNVEKFTVVAETNGQPGRRVEHAPSLSLTTNKWLRLTCEIKSDQSGKLECTSVIAKLGPHFTICCRAESPASMDDLPIWKFEDRVVTYPTKDPSLAFSAQKATQIEEPDAEVDLILGTSGPALVEESFVVPITVISKGHTVNSGELKINLVDVRGGGLVSPRELEPISSDSHDVELLRISGIGVDSESDLAFDKVMKIQQSFGLISVPFIKSGDSWDCKLEIKWHRPKSIMLYVSLGYFPRSNEASAQKVHVHRSLQIEGKTAVTISHRCMLPFQQVPLLLSSFKAVPRSEPSILLPQNQTYLLLISATNCTEVPLQLQSMSIEDNVENSICSGEHPANELMESPLLMPGEEFKKIFVFVSRRSSSNFSLGTVCLQWRRNAESEDRGNNITSSVLTKLRLPDAITDLSPLVVSSECPPYVILGDPFTYFLKVRNQSKLLQEVKFSLGDTQSFVISGFHDDTISILPKSEQILAYKLVPLAPGVQQLPRLSLVSVRYSTAFQPSTDATSVFVFPSKPASWR